MKKKLLIIGGVLVLLFLVGKACGNNGTTTQNNSAGSTPAQEEKVAEEKNMLPENKFDATVAVPGTNLVFGYPSQGFYGLGAVVKPIQPGDPNGYGNVLTIQAKETYTAEKGSEFVTVAVALRDAGANEKTLKDVENIVKPNAIEVDYVKDNGKYQTINGKEFFLYRVDEAIIIWRAVTLQNNQVITVTLMYKEAGGTESKAAFKNNDKLFLEILNNISYK